MSKLKIDFVKMHAAGNDYVYFTQNALPDYLLPDLAVKMSDRHKGVGSDGIIVLKKADENFLFKIFNADGSEAKMCGNGIRCAAVYAHKYLGAKQKVEFLTLSGKRTVTTELIGDRFFACAEMGEPKNFLSSEFFSEKLQNTDLYVNKRDVFAVNVGNDHAVFFSGLPLPFAVKHVKMSGLFPGGVNVECASVTECGIKAEVYERGSGATLACGTGAVAVPYAAIKSDRAKEGEFIKILMAGGELEVKIENGNALLKGEVSEVFKGTYEI